MKNTIKLILLVVIIISLTISLTGCGTNSGASSNSNSGIETNFIEIGEIYTIQGYFDESTGSGMIAIEVKAKVLDINNNWIKVGQMEPSGNYMSVPDGLSSLIGSQEDWDYVWLNLDHVIGITK